ncbi:hypothetical protein [Salininema proteolyticum]|uniref:Uncharacterized protein n=1 Tax=Salininema proteolyticum TaxID=1607685 RepID=A0ABV8TU63_9ACTN
MSLPVMIASFTIGVLLIAAMVVTATLSGIRDAKKHEAYLDEQYGAAKGRE